MSYQEVTHKIAEASQKAGRRPEDVTLVVISKGRSIAQIKGLYDQGVRDFGENRAQELVAKVAELPEDIRWHFVGPLQTNKVKMVRPVAHLLHSMDRVKLARTWAREPAGRVLAQINIGLETQKHGVAPDEAGEMLEQFAQVGVHPSGLMAMAPQVAHPELARPYFRRLRWLAESLSERFPQLSELSMGMTEDYQVAIEEGATMVRVGRAVFGES